MVSARRVYFCLDDFTEPLNVLGFPAQRIGISLRESSNCKDFNSYHWIFVETHIFLLYLTLSTD